MTLINPRRAEIQEAKVSLAVNTAVWIFRLIMGILVGSAALIAEAWHSFTDNLTTAILYVSSRLADKPPDEEHPYGHERIADIGTLIMAILIFMTATYIVYEAIIRFSYGYVFVTEYVFAAIVVVLVSSFLKELLARYAFKLYKMSNSMLCYADGWHHRADALMGFGVGVVFLIVITFNLHIADFIMAIIISSVIFYEGANIFKKATLTLIDTTAPSIANKIKELVLSMDDVKEVHDVRVRNYGSYYIIDLKIHVSPELKIEEAHELAHKAEDLIKNKMKNVKEVTIHVEPAKPHK